MHDLLIAVLFLGMIFAPAAVAARTHKDTAR